MTEYLTLEDVPSVIDDLGVGPVRNVGLLDSAVHRPRVSVFGRDTYPGMAPRLPSCWNPSSPTTPSSMGTRRLGWLAVVEFYGLDDITLDAPDDEAGLITALASGTLDHGWAALRLAPWH